MSMLPVLSTATAAVLASPEARGPITAASHLLRLRLAAAAPQYWGVLPASSSRSSSRSSCNMNCASACWLGLAQ